MGGCVCDARIVVHTDQISTGLTTSVYNASRLEMIQTMHGAAQPNHARQLSPQFTCTASDAAYQTGFIRFRAPPDVFNQVSVF